MSRFVIVIMLFVTNAFGQSNTLLKSGCTDKLAENYDASATVNNGSCIYADKIIYSTTDIALDSIAEETSGLLWWNNQLWTFNDDTDLHLYAIDTLTGMTSDTLSLNGIRNKDWEAIAQDGENIYLGDIGNNDNGVRKDLKIYIISKKSIEKHDIVIDSIAFTYETQFDFTPQTVCATDFDCEAMVAIGDSLYLFTKEWNQQQTSVFALAKKIGSQTAKLQSTFNVNGLITDACMVPEQNVIVLTGYHKFGNPFLFLLYDFKGTEFFGGNKRKVSLSLPFHQVEGIATEDGLSFYISNEKYVKPPFINTQQAIHKFFLQSFLESAMPK